jgi:uncharacterized membrane protein YphA (DoxX/SURF4 family)
LSTTLSSKLNRPDAPALFLRLALAASFLSAVADRFGVWGAYGSPNVAWGDFAHFAAYTARLTPYAPHQTVLALAWLATLLEIVSAIWLIIGWKIHWGALLGGALLLVFALSMAFTLGAKAPLDFSVFTAAAAALYLAKHNWPQT